MLIYFADATHPQHNSIPSYGWIKKGQEKELKANCGRQRLNINGAINIETLEPTTGFYDTINADSARLKTGKLDRAQYNYVVRDSFVNLPRNAATASRIPRNIAKAGPSEKSK
jgi:hypothetical protein